MGAITRDNEERAINAMKLFLDTDVIAIYRESDNQHRDMVHDTYENCTFARGYLLQPKPKQFLLKNSASVTVLNLEDIFDLIPRKNLKDKNDGKFKLFTFYSIDPTKPSDEYNIMDVDPVRAFASRDTTKEDPLYLSRVQELYPGMQFNFMRNI